MATMLTMTTVTSRNRRAVSLGLGTAAAAVLSRLAAVAREAYCAVMRVRSKNANYGREYMPTWDGGVDAMGRDRNAVWPAVARTLINESADPYLYMEAQFAEATSPHPIRPNQLAGAQAVQRWRQYQAAATARLVAQRLREDAAVEADLLPYTSHGLPFERALTLALGNTTTNCASPLFRYCLAYRAGLEAVALFFYESALLQYVFQQAPYDAAWGDILPQPLYQAGKALKQQLLGLGV